MNKEHQLICSYVERKYFVSTMYRKASTIETMWYYETIAWEWNSERKERGKMLEMEDSGITPDTALKSHIEICEHLLKNQ